MTTNAEITLANAREPLLHSGPDISWKISFDNFRYKFWLNRWVTKAQNGAQGFINRGIFEKIGPQQN
jgi:hypothetical protein